MLKLVVSSDFMNDVFYCAPFVILEELFIGWKPATITPEKVQGVENNKFTSASACR
jgi:hypothetical protein